MCAPFVLRSVRRAAGRKGLLWGGRAGKVIAEWREDGTDVSPFHNGGGKAFGTELTVFAAPPLRRDTGAESVPASAGDAGPDRPAFGKYPDDERGGRRLKTPLQGTGGVK